MNIILLANNDLASNYAINLLLPYIKDHQINLFLSTSVGGNTQKPKELARLKFFEQDLFNLLISANLNLPKNRKSSAMSFVQMDELLNQPHEVLNEINSNQSIEKIKLLNPELIVCIRYGVILKDDIIKIPKNGVINLHSGLLPDYRGVMASFWAMLNQEKIIGTTLHYIDDSSIDSGRVIANSYFNVVKGKPYLWHVLSLYDEGVKMIAKTVKKINAKKQFKVFNQESTGSYYTFPTVIELQQFFSLGLELIDEQEYLEFIQSHYYY
jgi:methionyl-tRNA formyltransferase